MVQSKELRAAETSGTQAEFRVLNRLTAPCLIDDNRGIAAAEAHLRTLVGALGPTATWPTGVL